MTSKGAKASSTGAKPAVEDKVKGVITDFDPWAGRVRAKIDAQQAVTFDLVNVRLLNDGYVSLSKGRQLEITMDGGAPIEFLAL